MNTLLTIVVTIVILVILYTWPPNKPKNPETAL